jgi:hypothetical protein
MKAAEQYLASFGFGNQQALMLESTLGVAKGQIRPLRVSRLLQESDLSIIKSYQGSLAIRPRGVMSGFLVIQEFHTIYIPFKGRPEQIRLRLSDDVRKGTIFMAQRTQQGMVLEDVLVWKGHMVWTSKTFPDRWSMLKDFFTNHVALDSVLQRISVKPATLVATSSIPAFDTRSVLEWIPHAPGQRRLLFVPNGEPELVQVQVQVPAQVPAQVQTHTQIQKSDVRKAIEEPRNTLVISEEQQITEVPEPTLAITTQITETKSSIIAKRDASGPDVFQLWRGAEALGMALIRTMAISKALRLVKTEEIPVEATFNGKFHKWEIINVHSC